MILEAIAGDSRTPAATLVALSTSPDLTDAVRLDLLTHPNAPETLWRHCSPRSDDARSTPGLRTSALATHLLRLRTTQHLHQGLTRLAAQPGLAAGLLHAGLPLTPAHVATIRANVPMTDRNAVAYLTEPGASPEVALEAYTRLNATRAPRPVQRLYDTLALERGLTLPDLRDRGLHVSRTARLHLRTRARRTWAHDLEATIGRADTSWWHDLAAHTSDPTLAELAISKNPAAYNYADIRSVVLGNPNLPAHTRANAAQRFCADRDAVGNVDDALLEAPDDVIALIDFTAHRAEVLIDALRNPYRDTELVRRLTEQLGHGDYHGEPVTGATTLPHLRFRIASNRTFGAHTIDPLAAHEQIRTALAKDPHWTAAPAQAAAAIALEPTFAGTIDQLIATAAAVTT